jgi:hypothetical protein
VTDAADKVPPPTPAEALKVPIAALTARAGSAALPMTWTHPLSFCSGRRSDDARPAKKIAELTQQEMSDTTHGYVIRLALTGRRSGKAKEKGCPGHPGHEGHDRPSPFYFPPTRTRLTLADRWSGERGVKNCGWRIMTFMTFVVRRSEVLLPSGELARGGDAISDGECGLGVDRLARTPDLPNAIFGGVIADGDVLAGFEAVRYASRSFCRGARWRSRLQRK